MAAIRVNPTRMELSRLKKRRLVAIRGHKLMKDKRDELVRRFIVYVRKNRKLREEVEAKMAVAMHGFVLARASMGEQEVEEALCYPARAATIKYATKNVLSISVPSFSLENDEGFNYTYGFATTSAELDAAVASFADLLPHLIELAEVEKTCNRLAEEIEKTRRRVNALEHVMIPQMEESIKYISMKLDENERGNLTRLMKMKEIMQQ
jgi:V/A-type H+-transporting ATPase subunit D